MEKNFKLYMHTSPSGKMYFGITSQTAEERWRKGKGYSYNEHFTRAINKYGWENIQHIILTENLTKEEACHYEEVLIDYFDTMNPNKGYNIKSGGECNRHGEETKRKISDANKGVSNGMYGKKHTEESRVKMSKNNARYWRGNTRTEESRVKMSEAHKGENHPMYGKHHTQETKQKISRGNTGKTHTDEYKKRLSKANTGGNNPNAKKVLCLETGQVFDCMKQAKKWLGKGDIYKAIKNGCKAGGYHWRYAD